MTKGYQKMLSEIAEASIANQENWIPACGGTEKPFRSRSGKTLLYCWNPKTGEHAYLDCGSDIFLTNDEAWEALVMR